MCDVDDSTFYSKKVARPLINFVQTTHTFITNCTLLLSTYIQYTYMLFRYLLFTTSMTFDEDVMERTFMHILMFFI